MPNVRGKKYPYTPKGMKAAEEARKKKPMMAMMKKKKPMNLKKNHLIEQWMT